MDDQDLELDSESGDTGTPGSQSLLVRKNISLKLKGKGRGRGRLKTPRSKKGTGYLKKSNLDDEVEDDHNENDENIPSKFVIEEDISKLEAPTFTTIDRGPPEPMHRNTKLKWDHRVNLIGEKVPNPMIHCCEKCLLPILIYGRMIPCKHVFCLDCAKKTEKVCPRCNDKVQRVEQTGLGTVFMCTYGGSRHGSDGCRRTYLSSRDLQAHINHRHLRAPPPHHEAPSQTQSSVAIHHVQQAPQPQTATPAQAHHVSDYENRDPRELRNLHEPPPLRSVLPSHHQNVDLHNPHHVPMVHPSHPPPPIQHPPPHDNSAVLPPPPHDALRTNYHPRDDTHPPAHLPPRPHLQYSQLPPVTAPPLSHGYASPIPVMSTRTNLITVPIQDDTSPGYHSPHQAQYHPPQPHHQPPQPSSVGYPQQHPPPPQHPYSHPPPTHPHSLPVSYTTPASQPPIVYSNPIAAPAFSQPPPPTHFPPPIHPHSTPGGGTPSMYNNPPPVHHPPPSHPQYSGQRFTPPQPPQYDDSHLSSPPYSQGGPHSGWASQPSRGPPPPRPLGPNSNPNLGPLQPRPPYYHQ